MKERIDENHSWVTNDAFTHILNVFIVRSSRKCDTYSVYGMLTTFKVHSCYAFKIQKQSPKNIKQGGGGDGRAMRRS